MSQFTRLLASLRLQALLTLVIALVANNLDAASQADWEQSAYRIKLHLAADADAPDSADFSRKLASYLEQRIEATLYPWWETEISVANGPRRHQLLNQFTESTETMSSEESSSDFDKQMFLVVKPTASGYTINCREFDHTTQVLGPVLSDHVKQDRMLAEHCFRLLGNTFAPLAKIRRLEDDPLHVTLHFKGFDLSKQENHYLFVHAGDIFQPLRIRMTRTGDVRPGGINEIPWTYLALEDPDKQTYRCQVHSATQHPFGVRRRGRVEHLAIAVKQPPATTRVRFYAQHEKSQSLMGYEVFRREPNSEHSQLVGLTDNRGSVEVLPGTTNITTLFLRSGDQLLAKVPVVPGKLEFLEIPIADDVARLNAQAALTSLREQLIDLVARRNILIARIRDRIEEASYDEAKELLIQLDELPGRAQFAQSISSTQNNSRNRSAEPRVQARIDKMFANTRKLLGRFLDSRPISDLQNELNSARNSGDQS